VRVCFAEIVNELGVIVSAAFTVTVEVEVTDAASVTRTISIPPPTAAGAV
jgi:hypothetical protein